MRHDVVYVISDRMAECSGGSRKPGCPGVGIMIGRDDISVHMRALIAAHGCLDAAAETLNTRWGASVQKGTLSKRMHGDLPWSVLDVVGLEDALGRYPVTRMMARRMICETPPDVMTAAQNVAKETGEAVSAIVGVALAANPAQRAAASLEIDEAIAALRMARAALGTPNDDELVGMKWPPQPRPEVSER